MVIEYWLYIRLFNNDFCNFNTISFNKLFIKNMIKKENSKPTKKEIKMAQEIKNSIKELTFNDYLEITRLKYVNEDFDMIEDIFKDGCESMRKEILRFIENERDNGNIESGIDLKDKSIKGFSASLCLSKLMERLRNGS